MFVEEQVGHAFHEELRDELFEHLPVGHASVPLVSDAAEKSVWVIEAARLELEHPLRMLADMKANNISWAAVMRAKEETRFAFRSIMIPLLELIKPFLVAMTSNRLA